MGIGWQWNASFPATSNTDLSLTLYVSALLVLLKRMRDMLVRFYFVVEALSCYFPIYLEIPQPTCQKRVFFCVLFGKNKILCISANDPKREAQTPNGRGFSKTYTSHQSQGVLALCIHDGIS